jgi:hypothetical protein
MVLLDSSSANGVASPRGILCRGLCRTPSIPTRLGCSRTVSPVNKCGAGNSGQTRMNTAPQYHSRFSRVAPLQSKMRNGKEEVVGSIPTRSTKFPNNLDGASACGEWRLCRGLGHQHAVLVVAGRASHDLPC